MKRITNPGTVLLYHGRLARVIGIAEGRMICLQFVEEAPCSTCGRGNRLELLEDSRMFQENAEPVETL